MPGVAMQGKPQRPRQHMDNLLALPNATLLAGDYRIERVLGAGGFGITYFARDVSLDRAVAIKEYFPSDFAAREGTLIVRSKSTSCDEDYDWGLERFIEEAQTLAKFEHPNIARVYRYFRQNNTGYMVLQFEEGKSFKSWLDKLGRPPSQHELDQIIAPLLAALELIHAQDFLHRDIAPDNIIIRPDGSPVLIDFGSARGEVAQHSRTVSALVKPGYSPFEQYAATGKQQGPWTDIYALGATLYHAVTGSRPIDSPTRITTDELKPAAQAARALYRPRFLKAIDAALQLKIEARPRSIAAWQQELLGDGGAVQPKLKAVEAGAADALARTRKLETAMPRIVRWPGRRAGEQPPAKRLPIEMKKPAKLAAAPAMVALSAAVVAPKAVNRRSLIALLDGVRAAVASTGAAAKARVERFNQAPAPLPSAPQAIELNDQPTEIARPPQAKAPPRVEPKPKAPRPTPKVRPERVRVPSSGKSWLRQVPWLQLALIGGVVATMIYIQDHRASEPPLAAIGAVHATTDLDLVRAIRQQTSAIRSLAVSPDSRLIAAAGADGSVSLIDVASGNLLKTLAAPGSEVTAVDMAEGVLAMARRDGTIELYDLEKGERLRNFREPQGPVWAVRFAGGNRQIVAAGADRKVRLIDRDRGSRATMSGSGNDVLAVAYTARLRLIAAAGSDKLIRIYEGGRTREARTLSGHTDDVSALAFSPDGRTIASASFDQTAILWSAETGKQLVKLEGHGNRLTSLAFSSDGGLLATGSEDTTVKLWDTRTGALVHTYVGHTGPVRSVAFLPQGSRLVSAGDDQTIRIWNAEVAGYR